MSYATCQAAEPEGDRVPLELLELGEQVRAQPPEVRGALEPLLREAMEHARFRNRVLLVARNALQQFKLDLEMTRFDLDATRREREALLSLLGNHPGEEREN